MKFFLKSLTKVKHLLVFKVPSKVKYLMLVFSRDFQHACGKMLVQILLGMWCCVMCIFLFLRLYNFINWILHIYTVFLKNLRTLFLYLTYELVNFKNFNRTDASLFRQVKEQDWKKICLIHTLYEAQKMSEASFIQSFIAVYLFSDVSNEFLHSFFKQVCFGKELLTTRG